MWHLESVSRPPGIYREAKEDKALGKRVDTDAQDRRMHRDSQDHLI